MSHSAPISTAWVQDTSTATITWGDIGDWDVSGVEDFSYAFSQHRDAIGGSKVSNGNPKAKAFVGTAMSKWITTSATTLFGTFDAAQGMNSDLRGWTVGKVTSMINTFRWASSFTGMGLDAWDTASVNTLRGTFYTAREMNSDLSGWKVTNIKTMEQTFSNAVAFKGTGVGSWATNSLTTLRETFQGATSFEVDLKFWNVVKVTTLHGAFKGAEDFTGAGLDSWITSSLTDLSYTFQNAVKMTTDVSKWSVSKVLDSLFDKVFDGGTSLDPCEQRHIAGTCGREQKRWRDIQRCVLKSRPCLVVIALFLSRLCWESSAWSCVLMERKTALGFFTVLQLQL